MITDFRKSYACGYGESTTLIVEVCIRLGVHYIYKPVGGDLLWWLRVFSCVCGIIVMCTIFRTGYIYIYFYFVVTLAIFHLRAPPTPDDVVGREGSGCSGPQ